MAPVDALAPFLWVKGKEIAPLVKEAHMKKLHLDTPASTSPPTVRTDQQLHGVGNYIAPILYGGKLHAGSMATCIRNTTTSPCHPHAAPSTRCSSEWLAYICIYHLLLLRYRSSKLTPIAGRVMRTRMRQTASQTPLILLFLFLFLFLSPFPFLQQV